MPGAISARAAPILSLLEDSCQRVQRFGETADKARGMPAWLHTCPLCGWSREATSATVLAPRCERCGGLLEAVPAETALSVHSQLRAVGPKLGPAYGLM